MSQTAEEKKAYPFICENCGSEPSASEVLKYEGVCNNCGDSISTYTIDAALAIQSQLSHLRAVIEQSYKKAKEEADNITNEVPNAFSKGKRNAYKEVLTLIDNLEES